MVEKTLRNIFQACGVIAFVLILYGCQRADQMPPDPIPDPRVARLTPGKIPQDLRRLQPWGATPQEIHFNAFLTGYTYWDNTPPQSKKIAKPVVHKEAGGTGTYKDPITLAVGHRIEAGKQTLDFPVGARFYIPALKKYALVEDTCGDGNTPQNGPCHSGHKGVPWLDIYIGGDGFAKDASDICARKVTAIQRIILNPRDDYEVAVGEIMRSTCQSRD